MKTKIGIVGGGNLGSILAVKFSLKQEVTLYTNLVDKLDLYAKDMKVFDEDHNSYYQGKIAKITCNLQELVDNSDYIFITFPSFLFPSLAQELIPLLKKGQHLVFVPGSGGAELAFKGALEKGVTITGLQRVHSVGRIIEFGKVVKESGVRSLLRVASIPNSFNAEAARNISEFYGIPFEQLDNYLNITLINSNPILHTSRLYTIFKDYKKSVEEYDSLPLFYEEWSLESAELLIKMDKELFNIFDKFEENGLPVKQITSILYHYESKDAEGLVRKLTSIESLKHLTTPNVQKPNGKYIPDLNSRYFTADFPYGLDILRAFAKLTGVNVPNMDMVSNWYRSVSNDQTKMFNLEDYGFDNLKQLIDFYK